MKILSVYLFVLTTFTILGCSQSSSNSEKLSVRPLSIAGVPVYDRDYQLNARENSSMFVLPK
nr:NF038215 family lipoprotein [Acinetobacter sp. Marseille-Q1620]